MTIKKARQSKKLSQCEVAKMLNVTQGTVSQWENNISLPRTSLLTKLSSILDCPIEELLNDTIKE